MKQYIKRRAHTKYKILLVPLAVLGAFALASLCGGFAKDTPPPVKVGPAKPYPIHGKAIWDSDHDTGIQTEESADEDKLRFDTAGVERMRIDENGKVNIGTTYAMNAQLEVQTDVNVNTAVYGSWFGNSVGQLGALDYGVRGYSSLGAAVFGEGSSYASGGYFTSGFIDGKALHAEQSDASGFSLYAEGGTTSNANYYPSDSDYTILAHGWPSNVTVKLPPAIGAKGRILVIKDIRNGDTVIDPSGTEKIEGALALSYTQPYESFTIQCDGSGWYVISHY
ncbi:MAG: hypothetical protein ACYTG7_08485 [Planctomycetota bacterium]